MVTDLQHEQNKGYNIPDAASVARSKLPKNCLLIFTNSGFSDVGVNNYSISNNCYFNVVNNRNLINNFNVISIIEVKIGNKITNKELIEYRRDDIGFVFQFYNLVQNLTALENVELATQICKDPLDPKKVLKRVGLEHRMNNFPSQLSGGEQQRVAIARAIAKNPKLLLCDEPTGALDYVTGKQILQLLQDMCRKENVTVVIITHNTAITPMADKVIYFQSAIRRKTR